MALVVTDAVVLHAFSYLESSRVLRLATRAHGVQSVLAKGARRSQRRFGSALDLFAEGSAQYYAKPGRELHTLGAFDVTRSRMALGAELERFAAASALAELVLRFARDDDEPSWYPTLTAALDLVAGAPAGDAGAAGLVGAWRLVAALGFAPTVDACGNCHEPIAADRPARFSHPAGGALCEPCARLSRAGRLLPAEARAALRGWLADGDEQPLGAHPLDAASVRAHQRLLREFLREHLADGRPLRAFEAWEDARWAGAPSGSGAPRTPEIPTDVAR
jgi:DNA repair protein RecO (recombination protein O)